MSADTRNSLVSRDAIPRRAILRLAAGALAVPAVALSVSSRDLIVAAFPPDPPAPQPQSAASIPAAVLLEPSQLADILSHSGEKPAVICVGFKFLYDGGHIPGALYRGPGREGAGIVSLSTWAGNQKHDKSVVIYCGCCPWNVCPNIQPAYVALGKMGLTQVKVLRIDQNFGMDWANKGYPTEKTNTGK